MKLRAFLVSLATLSSVCLASSQPLAPETPTTAPVAPIAARNSIVTVHIDPRDKEAWQRANFNIPLSELWEVIAQQGNLAIIADDTTLGENRRLDLTHVDATEMVEAVARQLDLNCWKNQGTYFVGFQAPAPDKTKTTAVEAKVGFEFSDVSGADLIRTLATLGGFKLKIEGEVKAQLQYIHVTRQNWEGALQTVAQAANALCYREGDTYIVRPNNPYKTPTKDGTP